MFVVYGSSVVVSLTYILTGLALPLRSLGRGAAVGVRDSYHNSLSRSEATPASFRRGRHTSTGIHCNFWRRLPKANSEHGGQVLFGLMYTSDLLELISVVFE